MAATKQQTAIELRLVARSHGVDHDLRVEAVPDAPARELVAAVGTELGVDGTARRGGDELPEDARLSELALRHGDVLEFDSARRRQAPPTVELLVVGGPEAGRAFPLAPGVHRVGRDAAIAIADPSLSAAHLVLTVADDGSVRVADAGSRNGTTVEGVTVPKGEERSLEPGQLVAAGRTLLALEPPEPAPHLPSPDASGFVRFNRPPRVVRPLEPSARPFPAPPRDPQRARLPLGASLIPLVLGVGLWLMTHLPTMLFFSLLAPVMAVSTFIEDRRGGRKGFERQSREYRERLAELGTELEHERAAEAARRRSDSPDATELLRRARRLEPTLWERRPDDRDFLDLRVGSGDEPSLLSVRLEQGGSEALRREVEELVSWYAIVPAVPVTVPVAERGVVGLCGPRDRVASLARSLVAQAATLHSPRELAIAVVVDPARTSEWDWLKWLPHTQPDAALAARLAAGGPAARTILDEIARLVAARRADSDASYGGAARRGRPHLLLVLDEAVAPERALVSDVLGAGEYGVSVLWLGRQRRDLPGECAAIVELEPETARLTVTDARAGTEEAGVAADGLSVELGRELALALASVRDAGASRAEGVPDRVPLHDLLGTDEPTAEWMAARWEESRDGLDAVIGAASDGPTRIDLRADGPHGLVAGMTGAGKSELLQTIIASLASTHPPSRLAFLLVDYKGGAAFKDCVRLPHTVGLVTDLDAHLTQRALASLNAELQRRERILRDAQAKDLADMEQRQPDRTPPSLLIVIDEFATLAKEVPDFVDGIVDVAQRGRSLGVHLLLATQRPGGVVSENIRANTNLRIALRVNEPGESSDVIGAREAARIGRERPGRGYLRTGHSELTEFQTAYAGGATVHATLDAPVVVRPFTFDGGSVVTAPAPEGETDLSRLVDAAAVAADQLGLERPPSPWLPPLEPVVPLDALPEPASEAAVAIGILDEPQRQLQRPLAIDLEQEGSVLVYGTSGSGKTTFLRALALTLADRSTPDDLHLYGLDFATRGLTPLEALPHTGAVVGGEEEERVQRVFGLLKRTLDRRRQQFADAGTFTLSDFVAATGQPVPRIVVLLDGYAGFSSAFERVNLGELVDLLPRIVADGRPLGVHFAITADRRGAVPNALAGIITTKIVLRMADEDEFAALGVPPKAVRGAQFPPGRGFLPGGVELHVASDRDLAERAQALAARFPHTDIPAIEPLPTTVERASLPKATLPWTATLGLADAELAPVRVSLAERHLLVVGPYRSGRSTTLRTIVEGLRAATPELELHLLAPRRSPLVELDFWDEEVEGEECDEAASRLGELAASRPDHPILVVIDDGEELADSLGATPLETVVRRGRDLPIRVLATSERSAAQRAFGGWLRELRKEEHGLLLSPDPDVDGDILGVRLPRRSNPVFPPGRGYLIERGVIELVQVAT